MKFYTFLFFVTFCFPQSSDFNIYGLGTRFFNMDVSSTSMGNSTFFSGNKYGITFNSPSSLWRSSLTRFTIQNGINYIKTSITPYQSKHDLTYFSVIFPIAYQKVFGFGIKPLFRSNKLTIEENFRFIGSQYSITDEPIMYKNTFIVDGGISNFFVLFSSKLNDYVSFGLQFSSLFGNQSIYQNRYIYEIDINSDSSSAVITTIKNGRDIYYIVPINGEMVQVIKYHTFSSKEILLESRYNNYKHEFVLRSIITSKMKVDTERFQNNDNFILNYSNSSNSKITELDVGYKYRYNNLLGVILELQLHYPYNIPKEIVLFNIMPPKETSMHLGGYYRLDNTRFSFWNNIDLRTGLFIKQLDFNFDKKYDIGITFGIGVEYLNNSQFLDIAFCFGKRENYMLNYQVENYINLNIGLSTGEKWFMKRRRK